MPRPAYVRSGPYVFVAERSTGVYYGNHFDDVTYKSTNTRWDKASEAIVSDHSSPTPYYREVFDRLSETPTVVRYGNGRPLDDPNCVNYDVTGWISTGVTEMQYWALSDATIALINNSRSEALTRAREKFSDKNQFQLGTYTAETKEAAHTIASNFSQLAKALIAARKGRWGDVKEILQVARRNELRGDFPANRWLEYQYGWKPLVSDLHDLYQKSHALVQHDLIVKVGHTSKWTRSEEDLGYPYRTRANSKGGVRCVLAAKISNSLAHDMQSWGLINPAVVAWELVPFSFCIDWGIPIGHYLNSLTAIAGYEFVWGYSSDKQETTWTIDLPKRDDREVLSSGSFSFHRSFFQRVVHPDFPIPELYGKPNPFSSEHVANAIALATQLFTGYKGPR